MNLEILGRFCSKSAILGQRMPLPANGVQKAEGIMLSRNLLLTLALGAFAVVAPRAQAFVVYTVDNPSKHFTLFTYDAPSFITADTLVPAASLTYFAAPPANFISSVEFIPSSSDLAHLGLPEVDVFQYSGGPPQSFTGDQFRWYPDDTFTHYGVTPGVTGSFGFPASELIVAAPEPATIGLLGAGLFGLFAFRRLTRRGLHWPLFVRYRHRARGGKQAIRVAHTNSDTPLQWPTAIFNQEPGPSYPPTARKASA